MTNTETTQDFSAILSTLEKLHHSKMSEFQTTIQKNQILTESLTTKNQELTKENQLLVSSIEKLALDNKKLGQKLSDLEDYVVELEQFRNCILQTVEAGKTKTKSTTVRRSPSLKPESSDKNISPPNRKTSPSPSSNESLSNEVSYYHQPEEQPVLKKKVVFENKSSFFKEDDTIDEIVNNVMNNDEDKKSFDLSQNTLDLSLGLNSLSFDNSINKRSPSPPQRTSSSPINRTSSPPTNRSPSPTTHRPPSPTYQVDAASLYKEIRSKLTSVEFAEFAANVSSFNNGEKSGTEVVDAIGKIVLDKRLFKCMKSLIYNAVAESVRKNNF